MSLYKHIRDTWKKPQANLGPLWKERIMAWRKENSVVKIEHPTRLDRARSLGYKAKQGFILVRKRILRGGHERPQIKGGRRSKRFGRTLVLSKNYQWIAEERVQKRFSNLAVLNSYLVGSDGRYFWYEVILVDPDHPVIKSDPHINWICKEKNRSRVFYGKTSSGQKSRGIR